MHNSKLTHLKFVRIIPQWKKYLDNRDGIKLTDKNKTATQTNKLLNIVYIRSEDLCTQSFWSNRLIVIIPNCLNENG